jgi:signal transduction histidine kinase
MSLGTKLIGLLLLGVLVIMGLDLYLRVHQIEANLLHDLRREVAAVSNTLHLTLTITKTDRPEQYFTSLAQSLSHFEYILGVVFYDWEGRVIVRSTTLQDHPLPDVDVQEVLTSRRPEEGFMRAGQRQRYYHVEPIVNTAGEARTAMLVLEDWPVFTREFRERAVEALVVTLALLVVMASIVVLVIRRSVVQPLQTLTSQVEAIGQAPFPAPLQTTSYDEIGRLAHAFHQMCLRLDAAFQTLAAESDAKLRLERSLRHSEKLVALGQFASRLAHEIGTPLNIIQGRAEQLLRQRTLADKERAVLGVIVTQIDRISGFVWQLLTLVRHPEPRLRLLHLQDVVRQVWEVVSDRGTAAGVEVSLDLAADLPPILGDAEQLHQVFLNLSVNALQAVGAAGQVTLRTRYQPQGTLSPTGQLEIEVADTGPGITPEVLPHIFEPFFTTKGLTGGTGLGLAISQEIVRSHHGQIRVESMPGQGSRFIVALPLVGPETTPSTPGVMDTHPPHAVAEGGEPYGDHHGPRPGPHSRAG